MADVFTCVTYLYRDASNYKFWGSFIVRGRLELSVLKKWFVNGEFFVPERIGIKSLVPQTTTEDDHELHEIVDAHPCEGAENICTSKQLVFKAMMAHKKGWFQCQGIYGQRMN